MSRSSRLRRWVALTLIPVAVIATSLAAVGVAQAKEGRPDTATPNVDRHYEPAECSSLSAAERDSDIPFARCFAVGWTGSSGTFAAQADAPPPTALTPSDLQEAYRLPDGGAGMTVAIVDAGGYAHAESDLAVFRSYYGLPPCTTANGCFTKVDQYGGTDYPAEDRGWSVETALDLDAVSSVCPRCKLMLVQGNTANVADLGAAANTAADLGADAISNSYGVPGEFSSEQQYDALYDHPGVAVTAATGDTGNVTNWPATSNQVIAVGGTTLTRDQSERGWSEVAWAKGGSGCSPYEARPDYQAGLSTNCPANKAIADISADADPASGIGVYNTSGQTGWSQYGGTSLSAPLMAGMYALAGPATPDTYPVTYPYRDAQQRAHLNDVTGGVNGECGNVLCEAGTGWDGPTGLGTPNGIGALSQGEHGVITGKVTDSRSRHALAGATVRVDAPDGASYHATTDPSGRYEMAVPIGEYVVTASRFGYAEKSAPAVTVDADGSVTADFALIAKQTATVSGTVTDGSGHGWPMYAKLTVDGYPDGAIYTDPDTGRYSVNLPVGTSYAMHVSSAELPGYDSRDVTVDLTDGIAAASRHDVALAVDPDTCAAPGYAVTFDGGGTDFTGWSGDTPQDGWTVTDDNNSGGVWRFDDPNGRGNLTGGAGGFAIVDAALYGYGVQNTSLTSPSVDLSDQTAPTISFNQDYVLAFNWSVLEVSLSLDGGSTWTNVWRHFMPNLNGHMEIPIPQAAGRSDVKVRFTDHGHWAGWWELDNVSIGHQSCDPRPGAILSGVVRDANTNRPLNGATVRSDSDPAVVAVSTATPDDPNASDGRYWLYSPRPGTSSYSVTDGRYTPARGSVRLSADGVVRRDWKLGAGHLTISPATVSQTARLGEGASRRVTFSNDGSAPVRVTLAENDGDVTRGDGSAAAASAGAPATTVRTKVSYTDVPKPGTEANADRTAPLRQATPAADPWFTIADYPTAVMDNAVAYHGGKVYVVGGSDGEDSFSTANVYDPKTQSWTALPDLPEKLNAAGAQFVGNTLLVVGGWNADGEASTHAYTYRPGDTSWTRVADLPQGVSAPGTAVLDNRVYVVGGCTTAECSPTSASVFLYEPGSDAWTRQPDYPTPVAFTACGGAEDEIVCAGGLDTDTGGGLTATYSYAPGSEAWQQRAKLPVDAWGAAVTAANGELQIVGGVVDNGAAVTNQAFQYDPLVDEWSALPNADVAQYRGGAACGLYQVGGSSGGFSPTPFAQALSGYDNCNDSSDVPWLSESRTKFSVAPGHKVTVEVAMDSAQLGAPGDHAARVQVQTDTPYSSAPIPVALRVDVPKSWGTLTGTVTDRGGEPLAGATVRICAKYNAKSGRCGPQRYTLSTDTQGRYQTWLDSRFSPLRIGATMEGYRSQTRTAKIRGGETVTTDFQLAEAP